MSGNGDNLSCYNPTPKVQIRPGLLAKHSPLVPSCMAAEMDVMFKRTRLCHSNWNLCQVWPLQFAKQFFRSQLFWESNHRHAGEKDEDDKPLTFGPP